MRREKHLLLYFLCLCAPLRAENALDLKTAEELFLTYSFSQKSSKAGVRAAHEDVISKFGDILPSVDVGTSARSFDEPRTSVGVTQKIPWFPQWSKEKKVLEITEKVAAKNLNLDRQTLLSSLRKQYFQIQYLEKKKKLTVESSDIIDRFHKENEGRYAKGFIPSSELKRSTLQKLDQEKTLRETNFELESLKKQFLISLGRTDTQLALKTDLNIGNSFLSISEKDLRNYISENASESLAISKLQNDSARLQTEAFPYRYLPSLTLNADIPLNQEDSRTVYSAKLSWNIFSGGTDRSEQRKLLALREQAEYSRKDTQLQFDSHAEKSLSQLLEGRNSYLQLKEGLKMWEEITAANQTRFQKGLITSKDLSDDISSYLSYATSYFQQTFDLLSSISDFCLLVGKEELFHTLLL